MKKRKEGHVLWFTGIPCSGKTTLAKKFAKFLALQNIEVEVLDSDDIRKNLSPDLGFTPKDRNLNTKRIAWLANILSKHGVFVLISSVASSREHRERVRGLIKKFAIIYVRCPVSTCISRGGIYKKLKAGKLKDKSGGAKTIEELYKPYQKPQNPEIVIDTDKLTVKESIKKIVNELLSLGIL